MFSCSCTTLSTSSVQDSSSPSCCQQPLLITARLRTGSQARPKGFVQLKEQTACNFARQSAKNNELSHACRDRHACSASNCKFGTSRITISSTSPMRCLQCLCAMYISGSPTRYTEILMCFGKQLRHKCCASVLCMTSVNNCCACSPRLLIRQINRSGQTTINASIKRSKNTRSKAQTEENEKQKIKQRKL